MLMPKERSHVFLKPATCGTACALARAATNKLSLALAASEAGRTARANA